MEARSACCSVGVGNVCAFVDDVEEEDAEACRIGGEGGGVGYELVEALPERSVESVAFCFEK